MMIEKVSHRFASANQPNLVNEMLCQLTSDQTDRLVCEGDAQLTEAGKH